MAGRISLSQLQSKIRQAQNKQRQAINKHNQAVRDYSRKSKQAIDKYNRDARTHNARVRQNQQRLQTALATLQRAPVVQTYQVIRTSALRLNDTYASLERQIQFAEDDPRQFLMRDLPQQETANSLAVTNALYGEASVDMALAGDLQDTAITDELADISPDLHNRWHGALYALNPQNPDATRHFCTSAREIFAHILDKKAPDAAVTAALPGCETTPQGTPTRRSKIYFLLQNQQLENKAFGDFVDQDIENVIELFSVFNAGTHGPAGRLEFGSLLLLKKRVEDALIFLTDVAG